MRAMVGSPHIVSVSVSSLSFPAPAWDPTHLRHYPMNFKMQVSIMHAQSTSGGHKKLLQIHRLAFYFCHHQDGGPKRIKMLSKYREGNYPLSLHDNVRGYSLIYENIKTNLFFNFAET